MQDQYLSSLGTEQVNERSKTLDLMDGPQIAQLMNRLDAEVAASVAVATDQIGLAIDGIAKRLSGGGRLFYLGAGTSGRLGVLDASECPPTFGVSHDLVVGIIAGGDRALRYAVEGAEDNAALGQQDLIDHQLSSKDAVCAISASGFAPYCIGALEYAARQGALTISLCCNQNARLSQSAQVAIEVPTGPEVLSGSTRLKAGTATKMVLNMLTTGAMVRMGKVYQNLMVDLCASNTKLRDRSIRIVMHALSMDFASASKLYEQSNHNIKAAIVMYNAHVSLSRAEEALKNANGFVSIAISECKESSKP